MNEAETGTLNVEETKKTIFVFSSLCLLLSLIVFQFLSHPCTLIIRQMERIGGSHCPWMGFKSTLSVKG